MKENESNQIEKSINTTFDDELSPSSKRSRLAINTNNEMWKIMAILNPKYLSDISSRNAVAFIVKDRTKISNIVKKLDNTFALSEKDRFIKRVRIGEGKERDISILIHIFEKNDIDDSVQAFTERNQQKLNDLGPLINECEIISIYVPSSAPRTRKQFEKAKSIWPCHFHQDKSLEALINGTKEDIWGGRSLQQHIAHMKHTLDNSIESGNATTIVDPKT